jgi:hypothetical protein
MNYFQACLLATVFSAITCITAMDQHDKFLLNAATATALIDNINNYSRDFVSTSKYSTSHPIIHAIQQMKNFMDAENKEPGQRVLKIARHHTVKEPIERIYDEYRRDPEYNAALTTALESKDKDAVTKIQALNRALHTSGLCIIKSIAAYSSYRFPTSWNPDYQAQFEETLKLNNDADPKDAGVYIAGTYTMFVAMQEILATMSEQSSLQIHIH